MRIYHTGCHPPDQRWHTSSPYRVGEPTKPADPTNPTQPTKPADPTSPQTGDNSHLFLWIALLLISGSALAGTAVYGKKRKYNAK